MMTDTTITAMRRRVSRMAEIRKCRMLSRKRIVVMKLYITAMLVWFPFKGG